MQLSTTVTIQDYEIKSTMPNSVQTLSEIKLQFIMDIKEYSFSII